MGHGHPLCSEYAIVFMWRRERRDYSRSGDRRYSTQEQGSGIRGQNRPWVSVNCEPTLATRTRTWRGWGTRSALNTQSFSCDSVSAATTAGLETGATLRNRLVDADAAGAGLYAHFGAAATDFSGDVMVVFGAHGGHFPVGVHASGAGFGIEREGSRSRPEFDTP
jgi:hypothetical protein